MININNELVFYCPQDHSSYLESELIAKDLGVKLIDDANDIAAIDVIDPGVKYMLFWQEVNKIPCLAVASPQAINKRQILNGLYVDYNNKLIAGKKTYKFSYQDALPKAMGLAKLKDQSVSILDGTAGFTLDAYALLQLHNNISLTLVENSKVLFYLVKDGLARLRLSSVSQHQSLANRVELFNNNFIDYLKAHQAAKNYQIIYLDPMFEKFEKSEKPGKITSKPKQNMQLLQDLCSNPDEAENLMVAAFKYYQQHNIKGRVVLKRSSSQAKLLEKYVNYSVETKQIRYDVYLA